MSKLKSELRNARNAGIYIACAKQVVKADEDPHLIIPDQYGEMLVRFFGEIYDGRAAQEFADFHRIAHHPSQATRLCDRFYRSAAHGFGHIKIDPHGRMPHWPEFFSAMTPLLKGDQRLCAIVNKQVVLQTLPKAVWQADRSERVTEAATGIIKALGDVPEAIVGLDPDLVGELVKAQITRRGGRIHAAPFIDELRASELFRSAIAADENTAGLHVASYNKKLKNSGGWGSYSETFVLVFDQASQGVTAHTLDLSRPQPRSEIVMEKEGPCLQHQGALEEILLEHSYADLPGQEWVKPIAEKRALELG